MMPTLWKYRLYTLSNCHTIPDSANVRVTDGKILSPFVSIRMRFLSVRHAVNAFRVRWYPFCPVLSIGKFWTCSKLRRDATGLRCLMDERFSCVGMRFVRFSCGLFGSHAFSILYVSVDVRSTWVNFSRQSISGQVTEFLVQISHAHFLIVQWTFCPFLNGTYSSCQLYIRYTYVSWPFFVRYLFGTYTLFTTSATTSITG